MAELRVRRSLKAGLNPVSPELEKQFVYGEKAELEQPVELPRELIPVPTPERTRPQAITRVPLSSRIRTDYFAMLKRASLERQLAGEEPHTSIGILEEALEGWFRTNGYLK